MRVFPGFLLVLLTWGFLLLAVVLAGLLPGVLLQSVRGLRCLARMSLWWGFAALTIAALFVSVVLPMRSTIAGGLVLIVAIVLGLIGIIVRRSRASTGNMTAVRQAAKAVEPTQYSRLRVVMRWALLAPALYLSMSALGAVTNYDSGLYHLGAVSYSGEFSAIPGLANLYFPLGYGNAEIPLAALLGNGPWDGQGFRLLNGFVIIVLLLDLFLRSYSRKLSPGFFVLLFGLLSGLVPLLFMADSWVTSPTSDSMVFMLTVATSAYLADALGSRKLWSAPASTAVVIATTTVLFRPTMIMFAFAVLGLFILLVVWRRKDSREDLRPSITLITMALPLAAIASIARDYFLSGWIQYPLSLFHFNVQWLAPAADAERQATLGFARDPNDLWGAAQGWNWIGSWFARLPHQWEFLEFVALGLVLAVVALLAAHAGTHLELRKLVVVMMPSAVMVIWWWTFTPPSFRFAWGPVFTLVTIPLGWVVWKLSQQRIEPGSMAAWLAPFSIAGFAVTIVCLSIVCLGVRLHPEQMTDTRTWNLGIQIPYSSTPIQEVPVETRKLGSGLEVMAPTASDQCWLNYPLCTPDIRDGVHLRGTGLQDGFAQ